jgi:2-oxo-4-hydroxy-4-carboxy-5-ureidoimidazoline decarboxylase
MFVNPFHLYTSMTTSYAIADLNQMDQDRFVAAFGAVFEETPEIAARAWEQRPFQDIDHLHRIMVEIVQNLSPEQQLHLICAHPDLAGKVKMAAASVQEQAGAGLDRLSSAEFDQFQTLNRAYKEKFGFPFIIAVRNHTKSSILEAFEQRLQNRIAAERQQALTEIAEIARFRLGDLIRSE